MIIIGHRGAAGLALENTLESIRAAIDAGVDAIEFDIRLTKDGQLVLSHDRHTGRVSTKKRHISKNSLASLKRLSLHNGEGLVTLAEAIQAAKKTPLVIEAKESGWAKPLATFLKTHKNIPPYCVISFNHNELLEFSVLMPGVPTYAIERTKPFDVIHTANGSGFTGVNLNYWLLNPLTYWLAHRRKLEILVFTVNKPWIANFLRLMYPRISITTNVPNRLQYLRSKPPKPSRKA